MQKTLVVLAGGLGSRYQSLKQLDTIQTSGYTLMEYALYDAILNGFGHIIIVINENHEEVMQSFIKRIKTPHHVEISLVMQRMNGFVPADLLHLTKERIKPWGTGHAVLSAMEHVNNPFVVVNADDFYGRKTFKLASQILDDKRLREHHYHLIAYPIRATLSKNGCVARGICSEVSGKLYKIVERTAIQLIDDKIVYKENSKVYDLPESTIVSMNFWIFHPTIFILLQKQFADFLATKPLLNKEFFLPTAVNSLIQRNIIDVSISISQENWIGLTYKQDKKSMEEQAAEWIKQATYPIKLWK